MRRLTRSGIRTRLSGLLRVRKSRERHGEPGMRSVGRCLLFATTPLAVLLLTAAAAPADPAGTIATGAKRTSKTVGPSAGAGSHRVTTQPARPGLMTGWPFAPTMTSPAAPAKPVGSIKQRNSPRPTVAAPAPTPAPVQRLALPEFRRRRRTSRLPSRPRQRWRNADANANASKSTSDHRAGDCWRCGGRAAASGARYPARRRCHDSVRSTVDAGGDARSYSRRRCRHP